MHPIIVIIFFFLFDQETKQIDWVELSWVGIMPLGRFYSGQIQGGKGEGDG